MATRDLLISKEKEQSYRDGSGGKTAADETIELYRMVWKRL